MSGVLDGKRVLLVEDEALVALTVRDMLFAMGAKSVEVATNAAEGVAAACERRFDAAVLDVNLEGETSDDVAHELETRGVPVVYATGYGRSAVHTAAGPVIGKPYTEETLASALAKAAARTPSGASQ
jgi:CheY-like chemotaxis protein